jgi:Amidohydrolase
MAPPAEETSPRQASITAWRRRLRAILDRGRLPIIDLQATYVKGATNIPLMIDYMNQLDIAQIAFAPAFAPTGAPSLELHRQYPEYFIPTTNSGEFPRWWRDPIAFLDVVRQDLKSGQYYFMGEHEFRHYPSPEQAEAGRSDRDITIDIAGPAGQTLFRLSEEFGVAFQIHYEIEDRLLPALESILERHPKATVIWCHLAMIRYPDRTRRYNPEYVGALIQRFSGLHFDLAVPGPANVYAPSGARDSTLFSGGQMDLGWKQLIESHPERFLASSDYRPPVERQYPRQIDNQRTRILSALSERTRSLVAFGNAWRLITGVAWTS